MAIALMLGVIPFVVSLVGGCTITGFSTTCDSVIGWIGVVAFQIGVLVASAAAALVAAGAYAGLSSDWRKSATAGLRRTVPIIVATVVVAIAVTIGFALLIIPGIFLAISFAVFTPALMIERIGPMESLRTVLETGLGGALASVRRRPVPDHYLAHRLRSDLGDHLLDTVGTDRDERRGCVVLRAGTRHPAERPAGRCGGGCPLCRPESPEGRPGLYRT